MRNGVWIATCAGLAASLTGCPNPNLYTTPRTLPPGAVQWQVAPEFIGVNYNQTITTFDAAGNPTTTKAGVTASAPMVPSFGARVGVAQNVDIGLHLQNFDSVEADVKWLVLKGPFDVALNPGAQGYYVSIGGTGVGVTYFHLPVLLGINLSRTASIVLSPGAVFSVASASVNDGSGLTGSSSATGFMGRLGVGVDLRVSNNIALHPEITFLHQFSDQDLLLWVAGFGINIGPQPDYSDLGGGAPSPPPPPPSEPPPSPAPAPPAPPPPPASPGVEVK